MSCNHAIPTSMKRNSEKKSDFDNLQNNVNLSYFLTFATKNAIGSLGRGRLHAGIANGF